MRLLRKVIKVLGVLLLVIVAAIAAFVWWTHPKRSVDGVFVREAGAGVYTFRQVARGRALSPLEADEHAGKILAGMTLQEKVLQMSGDTWLWDMFKLLTIDAVEVQRPPDHRRRRPAPRDPADRLLRRPARGRARPLDLLPQRDAARRELGPRAAAAGRRRDREGDPRPGRQPLGRHVRQPAAPPVVGPRAGDARRGPVPARRAGGARGRGGAGPQRDGVREALRAQLDRGDADAGGRAGRRAHAARGLPAALQAAGRRRRGLLHERLQQGERRLLRREQASPPRHPEGRVGLARAS